MLALRDLFAPAIEEAFYGVQPLAVKMGFPLGMHAGRMVFVPGGMGGGGGDLEFSIREDFKDILSSKEQTQRVNKMGSGKLCIKKVSPGPDELVLVRLEGFATFNPRTRNLDILFCISPKGL